MENNKYTFELDTFTGGTVKDEVEADNLMEAFNIIDDQYGIDSIQYKNLRIKLKEK